jgi:hypothetical protein
LVLTTLGVATSFGAVTGCGGAGDGRPDTGIGPVTDGGTSALEDAASDVDAAVDAAAMDAGAADAGDLGPRVIVHLRASHEPVPHVPTTSGQTPREWRGGIRSLALLRDRDDPSPMVVFSHGDDYVEVSYDDGADNVVGSAPIAALRTGTYTWARVVHTHTRFAVDARIHTPVGPVPGDIDALLVLSDRTVIDGETHARGHYEYDIRAGGTVYPLAGEGLVLPPSDSGGFAVTTEDGEMVYYFPALVTVAPITEDTHFIFEVNVHEGFRWIDQPSPAFVDGQLDVSVAETERIVQVGANSYRFFTE